jgi:hypothetical protein
MSRATIAEQMRSNEMNCTPGFPPPEPGSPAAGPFAGVGRPFRATALFYASTMPKSSHSVATPVDRTPRPNRAPLAAAILSIVVLSLIGWAAILALLSCAF